MNKTRCSWATRNAYEQEYHDNEWGIPSYDDNYLFEMLILEGLQAGLSWVTILKKREAYRNKIDNFDYNKIANYSDDKLEELLLDSDLIRHRLKMYALRTNALAFIKVRDEFETFANYIWQYTENKPIVNHYKNSEEVPTSSTLSDNISKDLKKRGFKFVGTTIIYAYMGAIGMVNDHLDDCFYKNR